MFEELAEHGFDGLSVERVAKAAELNKTSVYRRHATKEALVSAAMESVLDDIELSLPDTGALVDDLKAIVTVVQKHLSTPIGRALLHTAMAPNLTAQVAAVAQRRLEDNLATPAAALVQRAVERGEWRADASPHVVFSALVGAVLHSLLLEGRAASSAFVDDLVDVLVRGVAPPPQGRS